jgi:hypothetical protein
LFAFDFPFTLPETLPASEVNADKGSATLNFRKLKSKEVFICNYKGGAPVVKKGQTRPITKEFTFAGCTKAGALDSTIQPNSTQSAAWFQLSVNGNTKLDGATKTQVDVVFQRVK